MADNAHISGSGKGGQSDVEAQISAMREFLLANEAADNAISASADGGIILDPEKLPAARRLVPPAVKEPSTSVSTSGKTSYYCLRIDAFKGNTASLYSALMDLTGLDFFSVVEMKDRIPGTFMFATTSEALEDARCQLEDLGATVAVVRQESVPPAAVLMCGEGQKDGTEGCLVEGFGSTNDVILEDVGDNSGKVSIAVRDLTGRSFHGAKYLMESNPAVVLSGVSPAEASRAKVRLELAGAKASVEPSKKH